MTIRLGSGMNCVVLRRRDYLEIIGIRTLQSTNERCANLAGEKWVFAIGLLPPPPTRIANDVDVWRPERQAIVDRMITVPQRLVVLCPSLGRDRVGYAID